MSWVAGSSSSSKRSGGGGGGGKSRWRRREGTNGGSFERETTVVERSPRDTQTEQVSSPEPKVALHIGCRKKGETADVDAPVEDHVNTLDRDGWVNNDTFTCLWVLA